MAKQSFLFEKNLSNEVPLRLPIDQIAIRPDTLAQEAEILWLWREFRARQLAL